jgi:hypothetical protein
MLPKIGLGMGICIVGGGCNQPVGVGIGSMKQVLKGLPGTRLQTLQRMVACYNAGSWGGGAFLPFIGYN